MGKEIEMVGEGGRLIEKYLRKIETGGETPSRPFKCNRLKKARETQTGEKEAWGEEGEETTSREGKRKSRQMEKWIQGEEKGPQREKDREKERKRERERERERERKREREREKERCAYQTKEDGEITRQESAGAPLQVT